MKNELEGKIMTKFVELRAKAYSHIIVRMEKQKAQKSVPKKRRKFQFQTALKQLNLKIK